MSLKARYIGESFGVDGLTNGKVYDVLDIEGGLLRVVDDSEEDYLYSAEQPAPMDMSSPGGRWEVAEDDEQGSLKKAIIGSK